MQRGFVIYENIADLHTPLMPLLISALTPWIPNGLKLAKLTLVALLSISALLTFIQGKRLSGWSGGLWAFGFFVVWSPAFGFEKLWYESFLTPLYLLLPFFYNPSGTGRSIKASLLLGFLGAIMVLFKQHAALVFGSFIAWDVLTTWYTQRTVKQRLGEIGWVGLTFVLTVLAYMVYQYSRAGSLANFFYWTIGYSLTSDYETLAAKLPTAFQMGVVASSCLVLPAAFFYCVESIRKRDNTWCNLGLALLLAVTSSVTAYPRFGFFHLQATLPWLALASALTISSVLWLEKKLRSFVMGILFALSIYWLITAGLAYRPVLSAPVSQHITEYSELQPLAKAIKKYIQQGDDVYIFPDDEATANLYYILKEKPPEFWIFHYSWYMSSAIKSHILAVLESDKPAWIIYFPQRWQAENYTPEIMVFIEKYYKPEAKSNLEMGGRAASQAGAVEIPKQVSEWQLCQARN